MGLRWQRELPHWVLLWLMLGLAAYAWDRAPDNIPIHWGISGEADRYAGKGQGLLALPIVAAVMYVALLFAPRLVRATEAQLGSLYDWLRLGITLMLAGLYAAIVLEALGAPVDVGRVAPMLVGALLLAVGAVMGKMRPNAIMGVRTPWTLTSQASWDASHRVGGWVFIVVGTLMVLGGLNGEAWQFVAALVILFGGMIGVIAYGWWIWRSDPKRLPRGQTLLTAPARPAASGRQLSGKRSPGKQSLGSQPASTPANTPGASTGDRSRTGQRGPARRRSSGRRSRGGR